MARSFMIIPLLSHASHVYRNLSFFSVSLRIIVLRGSHFLLQNRSAFIRLKTHRLPVLQLDSLVFMGDFFLHTLRYHQLCSYIDLFHVLPSTNFWSITRQKGCR